MQQLKSHIYAWPRYKDKNKQFIWGIAVIREGQVRRFWATVRDDEIHDRVKELKNSYEVKSVHYYCPTALEQFEFLDTEIGALTGDAVEEEEAVNE